MKLQYVRLWVVGFPPITGPGAWIATICWYYLRLYSADTQTVPPARSLSILINTPDDDLSWKSLYSIKNRKKQIFNWKTWKRERVSLHWRWFLDFIIVHNEPKKNHRSEILLSSTTYIYIIYLYLKQKDKKGIYRVQISNHLQS